MNELLDIAGAGGVTGPPSPQLPEGFCRSDREVAAWCATAILPGDRDPDASTAGDIRRNAERFVDWIDDADSDVDRAHRRSALVIACHQPTSNCQRVLVVAKEIHRFLAGR
jgi:hypothetical protein